MSKVREIKYRRVHQHYETGDITYTYWGFIDQDSRVFIAPKSVNNHVVISEDCITGLKDRGGKEIYEGDIVEVITSIDSSEDFLEEPNKVEQAIICQVQYNPPCFDLNTIEEDLHLKFWSLSNDSVQEEIEVIGNIHQKKES